VEVNTAGHWAVVDRLGVQLKVDTRLIDEKITPGEYLMIHAGHAIGKIDLNEAKETLKLWEEVISC
jgi:hydrogenase expression/formation protein HypC